MSDSLGKDPAPSGACISVCCLLSRRILLQTSEMQLLLLDDGMLVPRMNCATTSHGPMHACSISLDHVICTTSTVWFYRTLPNSPLAQESNVVSVARDMLAPATALWKRQKGVQYNTSTLRLYPGLTDFLG